MDGAAALAVWRMKEQAALLQVNCTICRVKGENCVGPHAGYRLVLCDQFRTRGCAGAQNVRHGEYVFDRRRFLFLVCGGNDLHVVYDLREFRLFQVNGMTGGSGENTTETHLECGKLLHISLRVKLHLLPAREKCTLLGQKCPNIT